MPKKFQINFPIILVVLDGWGIDDPNKGNAISLAKTPTMDNLLKKYSSTQLRAHGKYVGLPSNQVGNSEAGHMNIGAGRLVAQDAIKISASIKDGTFFKNSAFLGALRHIKKMNSRIHIMGMLSNGQSPHSDPKHLFALLDLMKKHNVKNVYLHLFTDGRDSPKYAALKLIEELEDKHLHNFKIVTIMGRFYAMDRKKKWSRTRKAFRALTLGEGRKTNTPVAAITEAYNRGESDEFIEPYIIDYDNGNENTRIKEGDSVIFFNLRSDRSRQLAKAFVQSDFSKSNPSSFKRGKKLQHIYFVGMTDFGPDLEDILTAFPSVDLRQTLPMQFSDIKQLYIAETEKYAHVTYFLNGGYAGKVAGEDQIMIPSPDVRSYDLVPAMSTKKLIKNITGTIKPRKFGSGRGWEYDFIFLNIAAPDMVGHTGNLTAAVETCSQVDFYLDKLVQTYLSVNGTIMIFADHGNIEKMINLESGEIYTEHTTNPVPYILVNNKLKNKIKLRKNGSLRDIVPTLLALLGRKKPKEMNGGNLVIS